MLQGWMKYLPKSQQQTVLCFRAKSLRYRTFGKWWILCLWHL